MVLFRRKGREPRRALCLGALFMRGGLEHVVRGGDGAPGGAPSQERVLADLLAWLEHTGLRKDQSPEERRLCAQPLGSWTDQDVLDAAWRAESLGVLHWALGHVDSLPAWDEAFAPAEVIPPLRLLGDPGDYVAGARQRPPDELGRMRDLAELWHWRARTTQLLHAGDVTPPDGWTFEQIIAVSAGRSHEEGDILEPIDGDFPVLGKSYAALDEDELAVVTSIAMERHLALNWLCGHHKNWDETPTDT